MQRICLLLLALAAVPAAIWLQARTPLPPGAASLLTGDAVRRRAEELRPQIERALGAPIPGAIDVRVISRSQLADVLRSEMPVILDVERLGGTPVVTESLASLILAKVELAGGRLNVCPASFRHIDELTGHRFDLRSRAFRDAVLVHELVHVFQFRTADGPRYFGRSAGIPELHGPSSVAEGHAQFIAERVCRSLGIEEAFGQLTGLTTGDVPGCSEEMRAKMRALAGFSAFPYYRGEQLVARVVRERGYEPAVAALFEAPPRNQLDVTVPQRYLPPDAAARRYATAAQRVERYFGERYGAGAKLRDPRFRERQEERGRSDDEMEAHAERLWGDDGVVRTLLCSVDLRLEWKRWSLVEIAERSAGFVSGDRFTAPDADGRVTLYRFGNEDAAERFRKWRAGEQPSASGSWTPGGSAGRAWMRVNPRTEIPLEGCVVTRQDCVVVEVRASVAGLGTPDRDLRWARAVRELVRSAYEPSPWTGLAFRELPAAFIEASRAPEWGTRWRAVRNLGRLDPDVHGVLAAVTTALEDDDGLVRLAALEALVLWERESSVREALREVLRDDPCAPVRRIARRSWAPSD